MQFQELLTAFGTTIVLRNSKSVHTFLLEGIKIDIVNYKYEWIDEPLVVDEIKMATLKDIGAMKLAALLGEGLKKISMIFI